jgi:hypothetical protein
MSLSRYDAAVRTLVQHLQAAQESVWLDQSLGGGKAWWSRILPVRHLTVRRSRAAISVQLRRG